MVKGICITICQTVWKANLSSVLDKCSQRRYVLSVGNCRPCIIVAYLRALKADFLKMYKTFLAQNQARTKHYWEKARSNNAFSAFLQVCMYVLYLQRNVFVSIITH